MRINLQEILHPTELHGKEKYRYWKSILSWFGLVVGMVAIFFAVFWVVVMVLLLNVLGEAYLLAHEWWVLGSLIIFGVSGILIGDYLWGLIFIKSGYLSRAAVIRISTNRFPTKKSERIQRGVSVTLSILIPALVGWAGWYLQSYWIMGGAIVFLIWLYVSIRNAWRRTDAIFAGKEPPLPEMERLAKDLEKTTKNNSKP